MTKRQEASSILSRATRHVGKKPKVRLMWKGAQVSTPGDLCKGQMILGESADGFHAGLRISERGKRDVIVWGGPQKNREMALNAAQTAGSHWVDHRQEIVAEMAQKSHQRRHVIGR